MNKRLEIIKNEIESLVLKNQPDFTNEKDKLEKICPEYLLDLSEDYDIIISGGMITSLFCNREVNDIDVYLKNEDQVFSFVSEILENSTLMVVTDKSLLVNHSGQQINIVLFKTFKDCGEIFDSFDFTVCMGAYDLTDNSFYFHKDFLKHNSQRVLVFNEKTDYPIVSALRVNKYIDKGYTISKLEYVRVLLACVGLNITSYTELESHIGGMYGLPLDKVIDTTGEFDLRKTLNQLSNPNKKLDESNKFSWDENYDEVRDQIKKLLSRFMPKGIKRLKNHDKIIYPSGRISSMGEYIDIDTLEDYSGSILLYKYVKKTQDPTVFMSFYRNEFKYIVGNVVEDNNHGIHCGSFDSRSGFTYSDKQNKALIELEVNVDDIKIFSNYENTTISKALVKRVMDEEYLNKEQNEN